MTFTHGNTAYIITGMVNVSVVVASQNLRLVSQQWVQSIIIFNSLLPPNILALKGVQYILAVWYFSSWHATNVCGVKETLQRADVHSHLQSHRTFGKLFIKSRLSWETLGNACDLLFMNIVIYLLAWTVNKWNANCRVSTPGSASKLVCCVVCIIDFSFN